MALCDTPVAPCLIRRSCRSHRAKTPRFRIDMAPQLSLLTTLLLLLLLLGAPLSCQAVGYSYTHFVGPVRGPEQKVFVHDAHHGGGSVDFIAKPAYEFAYGVEDARTRVLQNRHERRDGDVVKGVYSVVDPDGSLRVVKYTADNVNGFQAEVNTNGLAAIVHGQPSQHAAHVGDTDAEQRHVQPSQQQQLQLQQQQQLQHQAARGNGGGGGEDGYNVTESHSGDRERTQQHEAEAEAEDEEDNENGEYEDEDDDEDEEYEDGSREAQSHEENSNEYYY